MHMDKLVYDTVTKQVISLGTKGISVKYNVDSTSISHLKSGKLKSAAGRFCLFKNKDRLVFIMVDIQSGEEFECLSNASIFIHKNIPYNDNDAKYVYELRRKRQITATIGGRLLCLKERLCEVRIKFVARTNGAYLFPDEVEKFKAEAKKQDIIRNTLRRRILNCIKRARGKKDKGTLELTGCSIERLIEHLESQFTSGMTWDNRGKERGKWHIDHIKPCNLFDLAEESEQKLCFHYTNLRPLWSEDNMARPKDGCDMFGYGLDI